MDVERLHTVKELIPWHGLPVRVLAMAKKAAAPCAVLRQAVSGLYTRDPVGVWYHPELEKAGVLAGDGAAADAVRIQKAVSFFYPCLAIKSALDNGWIKAAYSPTLRTLGEWGNFFPGHYPGGIPNSPGPIQSMLTSGLVGAGLGYGAGWLGEQLMPDRWEKGRLRKALAVMGGMAGMIPGAALGAINKSNGKPFNSTDAVAGAPGTTPNLFGRNTGQPLSDAGAGERYKIACDDAGFTREAFTECLLKDAFDSDDLSFDKEAQGVPPVNVDALGRTLWETGATPQLAGMTMGALAAAQQMPGGEGPGFVTPVQMAGLAARMGAGWLSGALVGSALGALTGLPAPAQKRLRDTGAYVSLVQALVPRLFSSSF